MRKQEKKEQRQSKLTIWFVYKDSKFFCLSRRPKKNEISNEKKWEKTQGDKKRSKYLPYIYKDPQRLNQIFLLK